MTNTHGAITEAIEALDKISKAELKVTTCPNVAYLKLSENKNIAKQALTKLQALRDAVPDLPTVDEQVKMDFSETMRVISDCHTKGYRILADACY